MVSSNLGSGLLVSPYDGRDYKFKDLLKLGSVNIPYEYQSSEFPFVYNQGNTQMCCACSYSAVRYLQESDGSQSGLSVPLSPAFNYGVRPDNENFEGMYLRTCLKGGLDVGSVLYSDLEGFYSTSEAMRIVKDNRDILFNKADEFRIDSYYVCNSRREIQVAILTTKAVIAGIPIFDSFYDVSNVGIVRYDSSKDVVNYGGHAVTITGWGYINNKFHWRLLNSWGTSWGDSGYAWLPEDYPWIENAYVVVDTTTKLSFSDYMQKYY